MTCSLFQKKLCENKHVKCNTIFSATWRIVFLSVAPAVEPHERGVSIGGLHSTHSKTAQL